MFEFLTNLFDTSDFPARWRCGHWTDAHGWLHIGSDLGVWAAYLAIPCVLVYFALRRRHLPFKFIFLLFGTFILACGTTHLMEALIFWWPAYRLAGVLKLSTALVSWATVFALIRIAPQAFALRSPQELEREAIGRKQMEELANALPQMVWTARPDGAPDYFNDRWYEYTGLPRAVEVAEKWKSILHPDDLQRSLNVWDTAIRSGNRYDIEYRMRDHKTGLYRWHLGRALAVKEKGDRERCLAAGMDAYVSKPLRVETLFAAIAQLVPGESLAVPRGGRAPLSTPVANGQPNEAVCGLAVALARVDGDSELLGKMIGLFFAQAQRLLPEIRVAVERGDGRALERFAHKLKGSMGCFGAAPAIAAAQRLERMGCHGDFAQTAAALATLEQEVARLEEALKMFIDRCAAQAT